MGLDAFVCCQCFVEGRAAAPPVAARHDPEAGIVAQQDSLSSSAFEDFEHWLATGCEHEDMRVASEHVGNWGGLSQFRAALRRPGDWGNVDALTAAIPSANGGSTPAIVASRALEQLDAFASSSVHWTVPKLIDAATREVVGERVDEEDGLFVFARSGELEGGLDVEGRFFVRHRQTGIAAFRAVAFTQELIAGPDGSPVAATLASEVESLTWPIVLKPGTQADDPERRDYPVTLRVVLEEEGPASFRYIVRALQTVLTAAAAHRHPVHWT